MSRLSMPIGAPSAAGLVNRSLLAAPGIITLTGRAANLTYTPVQAAQAWPTSLTDPAFFFGQSSIAFPIYVPNGATYSHRDFIGDGTSGSTGDPALGSGGTGYTVQNCRFQDLREGPRIADNNITIQGCYIRIKNLVPNDHADGIQAFGGGGPGNSGTTNNVNILQTTVEMTTGGGTTGHQAGIFFADGAGVNLVIRDCYVDGRGTANGAIWLPNTLQGDYGVRSIRASNVMVRCDPGNHGFSTRPNEQPGVIDWDPNICQILEWTNVRHFDGRVITSPNNTTGIG